MIYLFLFLKNPNIFLWQWKDLSPNVSPQKDDWQMQGVSKKAPLFENGSSGDLYNAMYAMQCNAMQYYLIW